MNYPIIVSEIKVSKKTAKLTKLNSFEDIVSQKDTLFSDLKEDKLMQLLNEIYNGKLNGADLEKVNTMSQEEKRLHAIECFTFQAMLTQNVVKDPEENTDTNTIGFFLGNRLNVSNTTSRKVYYQTMTFGIIEKYGIKTGSDFSKALQNHGYITYLFRQDSFVPKTREKDGVEVIVSSPKRPGAGKDILTKDGKIIFSHTDIVMRPFDSLEEYDEAILKMGRAELHNKKAFKHDGTIDSVINPVPEEGKVDGFFSAEFQEWIHERVAIDAGQQVEINN